jgi:hypothetical protein
VIEKDEHVLAHMEQLGAPAVRDMVSSGRWPANYQALAQEWLAKKDTEGREREEADKEAQLFFARRSNENALVARDVALAAKKLAEDAGVIARDANSISLTASDVADRSAQAALASQRIAVIALMIAIVAIAISIAPLIVKIGDAF